MTSRQAENALMQVPGWQGATLREMHGGLTNRTWLVEKDGNRAVLKIDEDVRGAPHGSRVDEAAVQTRAAATGLAGDVLYADNITLMTEYVEGVVLKSETLEEGDTIEHVAIALRRLHALPLSGRTFNAAIAAEHYAALIEKRHAKLLTHCMRLIESAQQPVDFCCCHNDLVAENMIATPDITFLDWEYACDNNPLFDLATVIEHHQLADAVAQRMLEAYFDGDVEPWRCRLAEQQILYRALYWLWLAARPGTRADELERLGLRILA